MDDDIGKLVYLSPAHGGTSRRLVCRNMSWAGYNPGALVFKTNGGGLTYVQFDSADKGKVSVSSLAYWVSSPSTKVGVFPENETVQYPTNPFDRYVLNGVCWNAWKNGNVCYRGGGIIAKVLPGTGAAELVIHFASWRLVDLYQNNPVRGDVKISILATQVGGNTFVKHDFVPTSHGVDEGYFSVYKGLDQPAPNDSDASVVLSFNKKGELVSMN